MTRQVYPKIFSAAFNTLIDIAQGIHKQDDGTLQKYNWLLKRDLIKILYPSPGYRKYKLTQKAENFINHVKTENISKLEYHDEVLIYIGLLAALKEQQLHTAIDEKPRQEMLNRLKYLNSYSNNKILKRGEDLINYIIQTRAKELILTPFFRDNYGEPYIWWANWIVKNLPFSEWAAILSDDTIDENDKRLYLDKLKEFDSIPK